MHGNTDVLNRARCLAATFSTHVWRLRAVHSRRLLAEHVGQDTTLELLEDGCTVTVHDGCVGCCCLLDTGGSHLSNQLCECTAFHHCRYRQDVQTKGNSQHSKQWGSYRQRALSANGIPIMVTTLCTPTKPSTSGQPSCALSRMHHLVTPCACHAVFRTQAWDCVGDVAIVTAADILERMCEHTPVAVMQRMVDAGCDVAIIGRDQASCRSSFHMQLCGAVTEHSAASHWYVHQLVTVHINVTDAGDVRHAAACESQGGSSRWRGPHL